MLLTFKRWPLIFLAATALLMPVAWAIVSGFGFPLPGFGLAVVLVFGVGGNFLFGLDQRRRLAAKIKQATGAREIQTS